MASERETQLEIGADSVEQQQWQTDAALLGRDTQVDAIDLDVFDERLTHL
jgi:hypothetical protein